MYSQYYLNLIEEEEFEFFNTPKTETQDTQPQPQQDQQSKFGPVENHNNRFFSDNELNPTPIPNTDTPPENTEDTQNTQTDIPQETPPITDTSQETPPENTSGEDPPQETPETPPQQNNFEKIKRLIIFEKLFYLKNKLVQINLHKNKEVHDVIYHLNNIILFFDSFTYEEIIEISSKLLEKINLKDIFNEKSRK